MADDFFLRYVRVIADYQFGEGAGVKLFPDSCRFIMSNTGRVRQVIDGDVRIATVKADSGLLTLSIEGGKRLHSAFKSPIHRVFVKNEVSEYIAEGKNVFAKHVVDAWDNIRPGDEIIVVDENDKLLATGKAILSYIEMLDFMRGVAVSVRQGVAKAIRSEKVKSLNK